MKRVMAILLAALMLFSLTACGGDKDSVAAADPNLGVYNGVSVVTLGMEMDIAEVYGVPLKKQATLTAYLKKDAENSLVKIYDKKVKSNI